MSGDVGSQSVHEKDASVERDFDFSAEGRKFCECSSPQGDTMPFGLRTIQGERYQGAQGKREATRRDRFELFHLHSDPESAACWFWVWRSSAVGVPRHDAVGTVFTTPVLTTRAMSE